MLEPVLILGGRGKTGSRLSKLLQHKNIPHFVATRQPQLNNERYFDWEDSASYAPAFQGIKALYIVAPTYRSDHDVVVPPALEIAKALGVKRFVLLSAASLEKGGPMMGKVHQWLADNADEWAVLRPSWFMQNMLEPRHVDSIKGRGLIYSATGDGRLGFIDAEDIARAALAALTDQRPWNCDEVLTGPNLASYGDLAVDISRFLGKAIHHQNLSTQELAAELMQVGLPQSYATLLASLDDNIAKGENEALGDAIERRTGRPANNFSTFLNREGHHLKRVDG